MTLVGEDTADAGSATARRDMLARARRRRCASASPGPRPVSLATAGVPFPTEHPDPETPLSHFCLLVLDPHEVDLLEINGNPQNRWVIAATISGPVVRAPKSIP